MYTFIYTHPKGMSQEQGIDDAAAARIPISMHKEWKKDANTRCQTIYFCILHGFQPINVLLQSRTYSVCVWFCFGNILTCNNILSPTWNYQTHETMSVKTWLYGCYCYRLYSPLYLSLTRLIHVTARWKHFVFDCCHSGEKADLELGWLIEKRLKDLRNIVLRPCLMDWNWYWMLKVQVSMSQKIGFEHKFKVFKMSNGPRVCPYRIIFNYFITLYLI